MFSLPVFSCVYRLSGVRKAVSSVSWLGLTGCRHTPREGVAHSKDRVGGHNHGTQFQFLHSFLLCFPLSKFYMLLSCCSGTRFWCNSRALLLSEILISAFLLFLYSVQVSHYIERHLLPCWCSIESFHCFQLFSQDCCHANTLSFKSLWKDSFKSWHVFTTQSEKKHVASTHVAE